MRKRIIFITKKSEIVELNIELAIMGGKVLTGDEHFRFLDDDVIFIEK
ncbi:MAG: hypothetical protein J7L07_08300 [Candidatus Odinarchaeota archaeon]|nr:hypothetical protein [Candidatus Odinarchaeota archaeon]